MSTAFSRPKPESLAYAGTIDAFANSAGGAREVPPGADKEKITWSFLKSVGLSHASTPLANVTMVRPGAGSSRLDTTAPGAGLLGISSKSTTESLAGGGGTPAV